MKNIPRITITDTSEIKRLVCHLIYSLGCPLTQDQLIEITALEQAVNYFDLMDSLSDIGERFCVVDEIDGELVYANTHLGDQAAKELSYQLPASIRDKMFEEAVKVYTRDAIKKDTLFAVRYAENDNGTCTVGVSVKDEESGKHKYYINICADNKEQAERIKDKLKSDPEKFRKLLDDYFT